MLRNGHGRCQCTCWSSYNLPRVRATTPLSVQRENVFLVPSWETETATATATATAPGMLANDAITAEQACSGNRDYTATVSLSMLAGMLDRVRSMLHNALPCQQSWVTVAVHATFAACAAVYLILSRSRRLDGLFICFALLIAVHWFMFGFQCLLEWVNARLKRMCALSPDRCKALTQEDARKLLMLWVSLLSWWAIAAVVTVVRNTTAAPGGGEWTMRLMMGARNAFVVNVQLHLLKRFALAIEWDHAPSGFPST